MANLALYRKYRSKDFDELVGQQHIATSLQNALKNGRISHAYLFTGPRGIGKTSTARILARKVNELTTEEAASHLDIIEIDAASNRRIDEIRDLREKVHAAPTAGKYKVYIIDEVHMLTNEAFNALLKTLEEPPEHVIFILATTEPHKLPDTIISRTQRYSFKPVDVGSIATHLKNIAQKEKIKIDPAALELIAIAGDGSFRDSISLLDQLANLSDKQITAEQVSENLGLASHVVVENLALALAKRNAADMLGLLDSCAQQGINISQLLLQLQRYWQHILRCLLEIEKPQSKDAQWLAGNTNQQQIAAIMQDLSGIATTGNVAVNLEAVLIKNILAGSQAVAPQQPVAVPEAVIPKQVKVEAREPIVKSAARTHEKTAAQKRVKFDEDGWLKALTLLKTSNSSLYALLRSGQAKWQDGAVEVQFRFQFHRRRLEELRNRRLVEEALQKVYGQLVPVKATLLEGSVKPEEAEVPIDSAQQDKPALDEVLQILGGEVVT